jgi:hypothetical protein
MLQKIKQIANNGLYFGESKGYKTALWEILALVAPEMFVKDAEPKLSFIADAPDVPAQKVRQGAIDAIFIDALLVLYERWKDTIPKVQHVWGAQEFIQWMKEQ